MELNHTHAASVFVGNILWDGGLSKQIEGLKVEEHGQHRNPMTRETSFDS